MFDLQKLNDVYVIPVSTFCVCFQNVIKLFKDGSRNIRYIHMVEAIHSSINRITVLSIAVDFKAFCFIVHVHNDYTRNLINSPNVNGLCVFY